MLFAACVTWITAISKAKEGQRKEEERKDRRKLADQKALLKTAMPLILACQLV